MTKLSVNNLITYLYKLTQTNIRIQYFTNFAITTRGHIYLITIILYLAAHNHTPGSLSLRHVTLKGNYFLLKIILVQAKDF